MELTVLMPCLNEARTVGVCIAKARGFMKERGIEGEVVIADNGSTDGSQKLAEEAGARVIGVHPRGYGAALQAGIAAARGRFVVMGDADDSYDFAALEPFVTELRKGAELVMGNRFRGGIAPGAMPRLHRYLGNPVLSRIGRIFFRASIGDFHCGLRGFRRKAVLALGLQSVGMEFASEMVVRAVLAGHRVVEVPTTLAPDGRVGKPHLRSWRDGWRHLRFLLLYSPRWLFLIPGLALIAVGLAVGVPVSFGAVTVGPVTLDVDSLVVAAAVVLVGVQAVSFAVLTKVYAISEGFLPPDRRIQRVLGVFTLEKALGLSGVLLLAGAVGIALSFLHWGHARFGNLDAEHELRVVVPAVTALGTGCQVALASLLLSILRIRRYPSGPAPSDLQSYTRRGPGEELPSSIGALSDETKSQPGRPMGVPGTAETLRRQSSSQT